MKLRRALIVFALMAVSTISAAETAEEWITQLQSEDIINQLKGAISLGNSPKWGKAKEVIDALSDKLKDVTANPRVRAACAKSLGKQKAVDMYDTMREMVLAKTEKPIVRSACVEAMGQLKGVDAIDDLVGVLKDAKAPGVLTNTAIRSLGAMRAPERIVPAVATLLDDEKAVRKAIRVLGNSRDASAVAPLATQLESPKSTIRLAAIHALAKIETPQVVPPLLKYYQGEKANDLEKIFIIQLFEQVHDARTVDLLLGEFRNAKTYPAVRRSAAMALGKMRAQKAIKPLAAVLLNTRHNVGFRKVCAKALGYYSRDDEHAFVSLVGALADPRTEIKRSVAVSLSQITGRYLGEDKKKWELWLQEERKKIKKKPPAGGG